MSTTVKIDSKIFNTSQLRRELGKVPQEMAEEVAKERILDMQKSKSGIHHRGLKYKSSAFGQSPRQQSERLKDSEDHRKTGQFSAKVSFNAPYAERLQEKMGRPILPDELVPTWEKKQKDKVEKVLDKFV